MKIRTVYTVLPLEGQNIMISPKSFPVLPDDDGVIYDIMVHILQRCSCIEVMSIRYVDKKCHKLTAQGTLWLHLLNRDFIFLSDFDRKLCTRIPERGYNIMRRYVFGYVLKIEEIMTQEILLPDHTNSVIDGLLSTLGVTPEKLTSFDKLLGESKDLKNRTDPEAVIVRNSMADNILNMNHSLQNALGGENGIRNMYNATQNKQKALGELSYNPTPRQISIYNSLIEWKEERMKGKIPKEVVELITIDIMCLFDVRLLFGYKLEDMLCRFSGDLKYGMELSIYLHSTQSCS